MDEILTKVRMSCYGEFPYDTFGDLTVLISSFNSFCKRNRYYVS